MQALILLADVHRQPARERLAEGEHSTTRGTKKLTNAPTEHSILLVILSVRDDTQWHAVIHARGYWP